MPRSANSGMPTYWMPFQLWGWTPGWFGSTEEIELKVWAAKSAAAVLYCGLA
ncbi:MAG: hypothetical protein QOE76_287 [Frankiales bacterium]|nr:hypothetical protein [Frankiales bacterium]